MYDICVALLTRTLEKQLHTTSYIREGAQVRMAVERRDLTPGETRILEITLDICGSNNSADEVFSRRSNEAVINVKNSAGSARLMVNLTSLAAWRADGTIPTDDALRKDWLRSE
jgi:hypothetical protein